MTAELRQHCQKRKGALLRARQPYESDWRSVAEWADPYAGKHLFAEFNTQQKLPSRSKIINSAVGKALRTMDAGFMGGHTSKSRPWFRLGVSDPILMDDDEVKQWLDDETQAIRDTLARSNFYTALPKLYHARHLFGVGAMAVEGDEEEIVRFYVRAIGTYALGIDHRGRTNTFWYQFNWTAEQIAGKWGKENVAQVVREAIAAGNMDATFMVQSLIEENPDYKRGSNVADKRKYRQIYWMDGAGSEMYGILDQTGFDRMPVLCPRWLVDGNDIYGPSPALDCLGDIKQLQHQEGEKLYLTDMITLPPLGLPEAFRNKAASLSPGSRTYLTADQVGIKAEPLYVPDARAKNEIRLDIEQVQQRIDEHFFADLFRMLDFLDDRTRTAYEVSERKEEKVAMLGPALESLTDELLDPAIEIVFDERAKRGLQKPLPQILDGVELKVEYTSILAQAQKAVGISSMERVLGIAGIAMQMSQDPSVLDKVNFDAIIETTSDFAGAPTRSIRTDADVAKIREGRAQQAQMAQMAAMAPALNQAAGAMKTAGETVPQEGSALESMAG